MYLIFFVKVRNLDPINFEKGTHGAVQLLYSRSKADLMM